MKHSVYSRDVSTSYSNYFQSVNKTTLDNAKTYIKPKPKMQI